MIIIMMINDVDKDICVLYVNYTLKNDGDHDSDNDDDVGKRRLRKRIKDWKQQRRKRLTVKTKNTDDKEET